MFQQATVFAICAFFLPWLDRPHVPEQECPVGVAISSPPSCRCSICCFCCWPTSKCWNFSSWLVNSNFFLHGICSVNKVNKWLSQNFNDYVHSFKMFDRICEGTIKDKKQFISKKNIILQITFSKIQFCRNSNTPFCPTCMYFPFFKKKSHIKDKHTWYKKP